MRRFAETCEAVAATTKKTEKIHLVGDYLTSLSVDAAACAAIFFTGRAFPRIEEKVLAVGGSLIWKAVSQLTPADDDTMAAVYRKHGDLGGMAEELLARIIHEFHGRHRTKRCHSEGIRQGWPKNLSGHFRHTA
jgi:hypothetical protein